MSKSTRRLALTILQALRQVSPLGRRSLSAADLVKAAPTDAPAIEAASRAAPIAELRRLAMAVMNSPVALQALRRLWPDAQIAEQGFAALRQWLRRRTIPSINRRRVVGPDLEALSTLAYGADFDDLPLTLLSLARQAVKPRKTLCIIATARNEGLYVLEWLAYHFAIGVEHVFLYTNDNDDGSDALLDALLADGRLSLFENRVTPGGNAQNKAYAHALSLNPEVLDYQWALIIDLDEYLVFDPARFASALDFARWHGEIESETVGLNWVHHGPAGQGRWRDEFIARRFPAPCESVNRLNKSMIRPGRFLASEPHFPLAPRRGKARAVVNSSREPHDYPEGVDNSSLSARPVAEAAWLNHYFHKSTEEYLAKFSRNRGNYPTTGGASTDALKEAFILHFMRRFTLRLPPKATPDDCAPGFDAVLADLLALPGVAAAYDAVKDGYRQRFEHVVTLFAAAPAVTGSGALGAKFWATLSGEGADEVFDPEWRAKAISPLHGGGTG